MKAYHFLKTSMQAGSGTEEPWTVGEERTVEGRIILCERGYHWGQDWYSALQYAPGPIACIVDVDKAHADDSGKGVSKRRKLIQAVNVERELRLFAADCAERGLKKAKVKDERSWNAIAVARRFAIGEATADELDAARAAAWDAARDAAWAAARDAAWAAAWDAAWAAARDAARAAETKWQRKQLQRRINRALREAQG